VVLTYGIGRVLWNETTGAIAGVLLLAMPYLLTQIPLMLVDVPTMFFLTLAVFSTIIAFGRGGKIFVVLAAMAIVLSLLTKYSAWVMLSVLAVVFLIHLIERGRVVLERTGAIMAVSGLLIAPVVLWKYGVFTDQIKFLIEYQAPGLRRWGESHASTFLFQVHPFVTIAALGSLAVAAAKRDPRFLIIGWMLFLVVILDINRIRYVVPALPMLALMAAYGLREIRNLRIRRHLISCAVVSALVTAVFGYLPFLNATSTANLQKAGAYLDTLGGRKVEVIVLPQRRSAVNPLAAIPILDLFTDKEIVLSKETPAIPRPASIETSPVRFTWEALPTAYPDRALTGEKKTAAIAVISDGSKLPLPEPVLKKIAGQKPTQTFTQSDRVFRYKTIVKVYQVPEQISP